MLGEKIGWKLFAVRPVYVYPYAEKNPTDIGGKVDRLPMSLVHGMPLKCGRWTNALRDKYYVGARTRLFLLDTWHYKEPATKGFCLFETQREAVRYLPRFRVRARRLALCQVSYVPVGSGHPYSSTNYVLAERIFISSPAWADRVSGAELLNPKPF